MDYEYSVIGSVFCDAETLAAFSAISNSLFTYKDYSFALRKFGDRLSVSLCDESDNGQEYCKKIPEAYVTEVCKQLSEKFACTVSMRKGYEIYGNANVFNGGSDYEVIEEKWYDVEFDNGVQKR